MRYSLIDFKRDYIEVNAHNKSVSALTVLHSPVLTQRENRPDVLLTSACRSGVVKFWDITSSMRMRLVDTVIIFMG